MISTATLNPETDLTAWDPRLKGALKTHGNTAEDDAKLKKACREMEGVFLNLLLKSMRSTVPKDSIEGKSTQIDTMQSKLDMELTRNMAKAGGIGLADMMYRNLKQQKAAESR